MRRHLAWSVGAWLLFQAIVAIGVPASMCAGFAVASVELPCTCDHGDGQSCPMHHPAKSPCSCRGTNDDPAAAIASLLGPTADVPAAVDVVAPAVTAHSIVLSIGHPLDTLSLPEAPPPRA